MKVSVAIAIASLGSLALTACGGFAMYGGGGWNCTYVTTERIGGVDRIVPEGPDSDAIVVPAIVEQATIDFGCSPADIHVAPAIKGFARAVEACGHVAAYVPVQNSGYTQHYPGHAQTCVQLTNTRFVRLDDDLPATLAMLDASYRGPSLADAGWSGGEPNMKRYIDRLTDLGRWMALVTQGARDLACPRAQIVPGFWPSGKTELPVAEGCGQRATYLPGSNPPFVMQSKVQITAP